MVGEDNFFSDANAVDVAPQDDFFSDANAVDNTSKKKASPQPVVEPVNAFSKDYVPTQDVSVSVRPSTSETEPFEQYKATINSAIKGEKPKEVSAMGFPVVEKEKGFTETFSGVPDTIIPTAQDFGAVIDKGKEEKGSRLGYWYNGLLEGIGSKSAGAADLIFQLGAKVFPRPEGVSEEDAVKTLREELTPAIRKGTKQLLGAEVSPEKEEQFDNEFLTSAVKGLTTSSVAMTDPYGTGLFLQAYDSGLQSINNTEKGKDLPETTKSIFAVTVGTAQAALEKYGLDKIFGKGSAKVANDLAAKTISELIENGEKNITAEMLDAALKAQAQTLKSRVLKVGAAAGVEAITGGSQEISTILAELGTNAATGENIFDPKSFGEYTGRVLYAAGQEAVGGGLLGTVSQISPSSPRNYISEKVSSAKSDEDIANLKQEIVGQFQSGKLSEQAANEAVGLVDKYVAINSKIPAEVTNRKEVADLIAEKEEVQQAAEAKLAEAEKVDEAFKPAIEKEAELLQQRVEEINKEIVTPVEETKEEEKPFYELGAPEAKTVELSPTITPKDVAGVPDEAIKADTRETKPAPAIQEADNALKDVESTEKALGKLDAETIRNLGEGGDLTKFRETLSLQDKQDWDKLMELEFDKKANPKDVKKLRDKFKPLEQAYFKENAPTAKSVSEAYHKAKKDGSYPEIVTAVEDLLKQQPSEQKAETPTQDTPTKSDKQQPSKGQAKGSVPTAQEPVRVDDTKDFSEGRKFALDYVLNDLVDVKPLRPKMTAEEAKYMKGKKGRIEDGKKVKNIRKAAKDISQRVDWKMKNEERHRAIRDIKKGKYNTVSAKMLLDRIEQFHDNGYFDFIAGTGGMTVQAGEIPIADIKAHLAEVKALKEEVYEDYTAEEQAYFAEQDALINEMIEAIEEGEINEQNIDEQLKQKQDENERAEKETTEDGTGQDVGEPQQEAAPEKVLTEKEKALNKLAESRAALRKKLGAGSGLQLQALPEFIAVVKDAIAAGYYTAKQFVKDFKEDYPNHTEQEIEDAFNEVNKAEDLEKGMEEGEPKEKKKTVLTKRSYEGTIRDEVKKYLEKKGLVRESFSQEQRSKQAEQFINEFGEDAALLAVENGDIRGAMATSVIAKLIKRNDDAMSLLTAEDVEQLDVLGKKAAELIALLEKESFFSGEQVGQLAYEYENSDIGYNLEKKLADYKEQFGEVPADVKAKFEELDKQYKEVKSKLAEAEDRAKKAEEELTIKNIQEANERKKKIDGNKPPRIKSLSEAEQKRRLELRGKYSGAFNDISRLVTLLAEKDFREYVGLVFKEAKGDFEYFAKQLVKEVGKGIKEHIEKLWSDNGGVVPEKEVGKPKVVDGKIVIPKDLIRNLVEGGIDNIEDLTKAVKEELIDDFPEITDREVRDAITDYGKTVNLNTEEIATQIRQMRRVGRILSALEDVAQKKRPMRSGMQRDKLDAQERALNKELREAMKELPVDAELEAAQQKTASDAAKQRLTNQIEDLQREIDKGERVPRNARTIKDDAELTALKAKRDAKKAEHEAIFKDEEYQQAKRLELTKANTQRRIEELQRRIKEGDFAPKKKTPLIADTELIKLQAEKLRIQEEYDREFYKASLLARTTGEKIKNALLDFWGLTRVLRATGEASFVGIQGLTQSVAHPKHAVEAMKTAISFLTSEKRTQDWLNKVKAQEWYPELKKSKLSLTEPHAEITAREELFYSDHVAMVWNLLGLPFKKISDKAYENFKAANPIKALERAAVGYLDTLRVMRFMDGKRLLEEQGITFENNPQAYKDMADVVNTLTGRGSIGALEQNSKLLSQVFFSPRNWASAFKTATPYAFYWLGKKRAGAEGWKPSVAQKMAMADLLKVIGATSSLVLLAALKFNNDDDDETGVELDPRSSDFMKIRLGNKRIDPWGGRIQQVVFMSRMIAESAHYANPSLSEGGFKNTKGEVMPLGTPYKSPSAESVVINMAINKLSPSAALAQNFLAKIPQDDGTYKDEFGNPYKLSQDVKDNLYPIYWSTISEVVKDDPKALDGLLLAYAFFGGGVNVYDKKSKAKPFKSSDADVNAIINKTGYVPYKDKSGYNNKGEKVTITPEQVDAIAKQRDEFVDKQLKKEVANLKKQSDSVKKSYVDDLKSEATAYAQYKVLGYILSNEKADDIEIANSMLTMEQKRLPKNQKDALVNSIIKSIKAEDEVKINYLKNKFEK